ncbi:50S ribosomal protein L17 [Pseudomonadota bacterium]
MRHRISTKKFNRSTKHRKAMFKNLLAALITHGEITTTQAKAKSIKPKIDKLITKAKKNSLHSRRLIHSYFNDKQVTNRLVDHLAPNMTTRISGYTRIVKQNNRLGDNTLLARIEFVDKIIDPEPRAKTTSKPKSSPKTKAKKTESTSKK